MRRIAGRSADAVGAPPESRGVIRDAPVEEGRADDERPTRTTTRTTTHPGAACLRAAQRHAGLAPGRRPVELSRPIGGARRRAARPHRQARHLGRGGARRRHPVHARLPPGRAAPDVLRRGLSRPDRHRVPPGLALRASRTTSTSGPTRSSPSTRSRAASRSSPTTRSTATERPQRAGQGRLRPAATGDVAAREHGRQRRVSNTDNRSATASSSRRDEVRVYDLQTRALEHVPDPGSGGLPSTGPTTGVMYVGHLRGPDLADRPQLARRCQTRAWRPLQPAS